MVRMNLHEVKAKLSKVARIVKAGETVIVCERNKPIAEIRPLPGVGRPNKRKLGQLRGLCPVGDEFFEADNEVAALFHEASVIPAQSHVKEGL